MNGAHATFCFQVKFIFFFKKREKKYINKRDFSLEYIYKKMLVILNLLPKVLILVSITLPHFSNLDVFQGQTPEPQH